MSAADDELHVAHIARLEASLRDLRRLQEESERLAGEARDRAERIADELRLLKQLDTWKRDERLEET